MATLLQTLFWFSAFLLFYTYLGYGLLLRGFSFFQKQLAAPALQQWPEVTLVITAYNEGLIMPQKIANTLAIDYPPEKLKVIVVSDGSTDDTVAQVQQFPMVFLIGKKIREGKAAALNTAMQHVQTPFVVFSDANALLNASCLKKLLRHFSDATIGGVAGEKKIAAFSGAGAAEGLYWRYESAMKKLDARFYSVLSATGELFALRTSLFLPLQEDTILDDFVLSLNIGLQGYKMAYEPDAFSTEASFASVHEEKMRKVRIAAGAFQALHHLPWQQLQKNGRLLFQFLSRRWLRWVASPVALMLLLVTNALLAGENVFYRALLLLQLLFYAMAAAGYFLLKKNKQWPLTAVPFYFLFMHYCLVKGWMAWKQNRHTVLWHKAQRRA